MSKPSTTNDALRELEAYVHRNEATQHDKDLWSGEGYQKIAGITDVDPDTSIVRSIPTPTIQPLYRAQYECRHCLERFEGNLRWQDEYINSAIHQQADSLCKWTVPHNCTPDIIGVADLQCFIKQS